MLTFHRLAEANDETRGFGDVLEKATVPETNETSWLNATQEESADEDAEMDDPRLDVFGSKRGPLNPHNVRTEVINRQRERNDAGESAEDSESMLEQHLSVRTPPLPGFTTSSPSRDIEINDRLQTNPAGVSKRKRVDHIDVSEFMPCCSPSPQLLTSSGQQSQSLYSSTTAEVQYSAVGGDESQSMSAAVTSSRSAMYVPFSLLDLDCAIVRGQRADRGSYLDPAARASSGQRRAKRKRLSVAPRTEPRRKERLWRRSPLDSATIASAMPHELADLSCL